jgi:hypothetical protein
VTTRRDYVALIVILALSLAIRLAYLLHAWHTPGYVWEDPDGYAGQALRLAGHGGWRWTFAAVTYTINGQQHALPPLYSVFLSLFALVPGFPSSAIVAQVLLGVVSNALVFALGRQLHSVRTGLIAAVAYALWVPNIFGVWSTGQEALYIPLILAAFGLLARAIRSDAAMPAFAIAGVVFGTAALTRSMPLFFVLPAACAHVLMANDRRRAALQGGAFVVGFLLLVMPYSAALSRYRGQITIIDTHGSIHMASPGGGNAPGLAETARELVGTIARAPLSFLGDSARRARTLFYVNGGRMLQIYVVARDKTSAIAWKGFVHSGTDVLLVLSVIAAPLGAAFCANRRLAAIFLLWTLINVAIASLGGFGGARLRVPFEPLLMILAAVVWSGTWRPAATPFTAIAAAIAIGMAAVVVPQVPNSLAAWPDYGVTWPSIFQRPSGQFSGSAGINLLARDGIAEFTVMPRGSASAWLGVRARGIQVRPLLLRPGVSTPIEVPSPGRAMTFVELEAVPTPGASPSLPAIDISPRR